MTAQERHGYAKARFHLATIIGTLIAGIALGYVAGAKQPSELDAAEAIEADRQDAEAIASRDWASTQVCPQGLRAQWISDKDFSCIRPASTVAAK